MPSSEPNKRAVELTDEARAKLAQSMKARTSTAKRIGFAMRVSDEVTNQGIAVEMPGTPAGAVSCCGAKDFLIDEIREFKNEDGSTDVVRCASSALLEMTDAPVHVHAETLEYYIVLEGKGRMVLGEGATERIINVQEGSVVLLPPGEPHGIASDDPDVPVKALLTFTPGLAPVSEPEHRDEQILYARTSERLEILEQRDS